MISILNLLIEWLFYTFFYNFQQYCCVRSGFAVLKLCITIFFNTCTKKPANRSTVSNISSVLIGTYFKTHVQTF